VFEITNKTDGETITITKLFEIMRDRALKMILSREYHYYCDTLGFRDIYFYRHDNQCLLKIAPEYWWGMKEELEKYNHELEHDPHVVVMPVMME